MSLRFHADRTIVTSTKAAMLSKAFLREHAYAISLASHFEFDIFAHSDIRVEKQKVAKDMILFYLASTLLSRWSNLYRSMTICIVFYTIRIISRKRDDKTAKAVTRDVGFILIQ